jgi:hypothetical protein
MKNFYSLLGGLVLCGSVVAQSAYSNLSVKPRHKAKTPKHAKAPFSSSLSTRNAQDVGAFNDWVEPVGDVMTNLNTIADQTEFLEPLFQDSTVDANFSGTAQSVSMNYIGSILDPTSPNLASDFEPILTKNDPYMIDSLEIVGSYMKVTAAVDTLYINLVWGDSTNATVFKKYAGSTLWQAPISTWRASYIGAGVSGAIGAAGNPIRATAPSTNHMLFKYVLKNTDTVGTAGYSQAIAIQLPSTVTIPAGNIVSCFYTFVPGGAYVTGNCAYSAGNSPTTQNINGFAAIVWGQSPQPTTLAQYNPDQIDPNSWCMGTTYSNDQRHAVYPASYCTSLFGDPTTAPLVYYHITGTSTLGIKNIAANIASVSQNFPNPFIKTTSITVTLNKTSDVSLKVYNAVGQLVLVNNESNLSVGAHTMTIDAAKLASGMYFYTVKSGDYSSTHKMIVE